MDGPEAWPNACGAKLTGEQGITPCVYGDPESTTTIALAGDSHALQWLPALRAVAEAERWRVTTYTLGGCPFIDMENMAAWKEWPAPRCVDWNHRLLKELTTVVKPDLLLVGNAFFHPNGMMPPEPTDKSNMVLADALGTTWQRLTAVGIPVGVLRDNPQLDRIAPECVLTNRRKLTRCATARADAFRVGSSAAHKLAATRTPNVHLVDLTDAVCPGDPCPAVIGEVLVFRDNNHLTGTYVMTLAPRLRTALTRILA
ncbi:SGNH hydrolase domain-containing protein [Micromonospora sp. NBS 11-29]|uniref:SGNH hydrolase domain-containing protein n=1 Tax=Micromonospora sp. NBS 11-29 TaxID=1960879 RepID=UPI000B77AD9B|nr:SGNH hydrolase domain-containing protein [Micromonospora sp. NBS 11-29]